MLSCLARSAISIIRFCATARRSGCLVGIASLIWPLIGSTFVGGTCLGGKILGWIPGVIKAAGGLLVELNPPTGVAIGAVVVAGLTGGFGLASFFSNFFFNCLTDPVEGIICGLISSSGNSFELMGYPIDG